MSFFLKDRIKETSRSTGDGDFTLDGAAPGFSAFGEYYSDGDVFFYAITDGQAYEVGSGVYNVGGTNTLSRFPTQSTNSDLAVSFTAGLKEVFVTYPAKGSVYSAESHDHNQQPADSGVAFYSSNQIVNYDRMIIWDSGKSSLGVGQQSPTYAVDVGGELDYSIVRASGFIDGGSGVLFSGVLGSFSGGRQLEPFLRNVTNNETGSDAVIKLSGVVDQGILLHKQIPQTVFMGPSEDCGCTSDYPTFRLLQTTDLPSEIVSSEGVFRLPIAEIETTTPSVELRDKVTGDRIPRATGVVVILEDLVEGTGLAFCNASNLWFKSINSYTQI